MPRRLRIKDIGFYHVINRGVDRRVVFCEEEDFDKFLEILTFVSQAYAVHIHTFCLMNNHYHILLETTKENISDAIKYLNSNYAVYFNKKYKRYGTLWQSRFYSSLLFDDEHFWIVAKYIERNPIKANVVKKLEQYKYQSLYQYLHTSKYIPLLNNSKIKTMAKEDYFTYLNSDLNEDNFEKVYSSPKVVNLEGGGRKILTRRIDTFFELDRDINRAKNIQKAYEYGYSKAEIARFLTLSPTAVARYIK